MAKVFLNLVNLLYFQFYLRSNKNPKTSELSFENKNFKKCTNLIVTYWVLSGEGSEKKNGKCILV